MVKDAIKKGFKAAYVLMDSWFTNEKYYAQYLAMGLLVIGMIKFNGKAKFAYSYAGLYKKPQ